MSEAHRAPSEVKHTLTRSSEPLQWRSGSSEGLGALLKGTSAVDVGMGEQSSHFSYWVRDRTGNPRPRRRRTLVPGWIPHTKSAQIIEAKD